MKPCISHSVIRREAIFEGMLENQGPLRIGAGSEPYIESPVDLAVLRLQQGKLLVPYIPGSSLKGVFRSFAATLAKQKNLEICPASPSDNCMERYMSEEKKEAKIEKFYEKACLLCLIFGSMGFKGLSTFFDAYPEDGRGNVYAPTTGIRPGIKIGRKTGAVERGRYDVEYVEPGATFRFQIKTMNLPNYALGLISKALIFINRGEVKIGGFKTRGFGEMRVRELKFRIKGEASSAIIKPLDERDLEVEASLTEEEGWFTSKGEEAWVVAERLAEAWDRAKLA
jgi:CRISPR-associated RAMP protein (TIGR02581 family)